MKIDVPVVSLVVLAITTMLAIFGSGILKIPLAPDGVIISWTREDDASMNLTRFKIQQLESSDNDKDLLTQYEIEFSAPLGNSEFKVRTAALSYGSLQLNDPNKANNSIVTNNNDSFIINILNWLDSNSIRETPRIYTPLKINLEIGYNMQIEPSSCYIKTKYSNIKCSIFMNYDGVFYEYNILYKKYEKYIPAILFLLLILLIFVSKKILILINRASEIKNRSERLSAMWSESKDGK